MKSIVAISFFMLLSWGVKAQGFYLYKNGVRQTVYCNQVDSVVFFDDELSLSDEIDSLSSLTLFPDITVPDEITAVVGDTLQVYFKSIVRTPNYKNYGVVANCNIGKSYPRYFEVKPETSDIGNHEIQFIVYGNNMEMIAKKSINLLVVNKVGSSSSCKNILLVGGSTYTDGTIISEVNRNFMDTDGVTIPSKSASIIRFIGRKENGGVHFEATGGYSWKTYATNALKSYRFYVRNVSAINLDATYFIAGVEESERYVKVIEVNLEGGMGNILCEVSGGNNFRTVPLSGTLLLRSGTGEKIISYSSYLLEDGNPFWHNGHVDFKHYSNKYCGGAYIHLLFTHLGLNGFTSISAVDRTIEEFTKPFIRQYHKDFPKGNLVLGTLQLGSPNGGYASVGYASSTQNWYHLSRVYWYALEKYQKLAQDKEFSSYVSIGELTPEFDCEYGYNTVEKEVSSHSESTENIHINQIHPNKAGKLQIADSIYRTITKLLQ